MALMVFSPEIAPLERFADRSGAIRPRGSRLRCASHLTMRAAEGRWWPGKLFDRIPPPNLPLIGGGTDPVRCAVGDTPLLLPLSGGGRVGVVLGRATGSAEPSGQARG